MSDAFSVGPYQVEILSGNEQRRFDVKEGTFIPSSPPATAEPPSFVLDNETIYLCPNATANVTVRPITSASPGLN